MEIRTSIMITAASFVLTSLVISNAFYQKKQFYPSVVYLTKSNPSMAVLYVQALVFVYLLGQIIRKIFFGQLRAAESEHLAERAWYAVTETCLAFTVFRDDFSPKFVAQFTFLLFLKCFHWLSEDRVDYMERSPVITILFHCRLMSVIAVLSSCDSYFVSHAYFTTLLRGASVQIVFGFEYAILMTVVFHIAIKYVLHSIDLRNVHPWENKAVYLLYAELIIGFFRVVLYTLFMVVMMKLHTFPLFSIRPMYLTLRAFKKAVNDVIMSRRAINYLNYLYPDAREDEIRQGDNVCIICREEMVGGSAKKLPCNHIFHAACLRSWFQRQQTCPTCRLDIIQATLQQTGGVHQRGGGLQQPANPVAPAAAGQQQQPPQQQPGFPPQNQPAHAHPHVPNLAAMFPFIPPGFMPHVAQPNQQQQPTVAASQTQGPSGSTQPPHQHPLHGSAPFGGTNFNAPGMAPFMMPPMMPPMMPFMLPFPTAPNFNGLSDEEVRRMEGQSRQAVEARIQCLRNLQTLLDAAAIQLQQYLSIMPLLSGALASDEPSSSTTANVVDNTLNAQASTPADNGAREHLDNAELSGQEVSAAGPSNADSSSPSDDIRLRRLKHFETPRKADNEQEQ